MALTTSGAQFLAKAATGLNSPTLFSASNAYIGVGDSATAFSIAQSDLQAATNKFRKLVTSIGESAGVVTAVATCGTSEANFEWVEHGLFNASSGGTMLGRKVESPSLGTKVNTKVWTMSLTINWAAAP
jgi:hypothetical protein